MAIGDQYRRIHPADQLIFDSSNNLVGVRSGDSSSAEGRMPTAAQLAVTGPVYIGAWSGRPAASSVAVNSAMVCTDIPYGGHSNWYSDGTNWRPLNGTLTLAAFAGSVLAPLGVGPTTGTQFVFALPTANGAIKVPAGLLIPGKTIIRVSGAFTRSGSAGVMQPKVTMGTTNGYSDAALGATYMATAVNTFPFLYEVSVAAQGRTVSASGIGANGGNAAVIADVTANLDTTQDMYLNVLCQTYTNPDVLSLIWLDIELFM